MLNSLKDTVVHIRVWIIYIYGNTKITQDGPKLVKVSRVGTKSLQTVDVEHRRTKRSLAHYVYAKPIITYEHHWTQTFHDSHPEMILCG